MSGKDQEQELPRVTPEGLEQVSDLLGRADHREQFPKIASKLVLKVFTRQRKADSGLKKPCFRPTVKPLSVKTVTKYVTPFSQFVRNGVRQLNFTSHTAFRPVK